MTKRDRRDARRAGINGRLRRPALPRLVESRDYSPPPLRDVAVVRVIPHEFEKVTVR